MGAQGFNKFQVGDRIECYELKKIARKLGKAEQGTNAQAAARAQ